MKVQLDINQVAIGACCTSDILDDRGRIVVGKGEALTQQFLDGLKSRGISTLNLSQSDLELLTGKDVGRSKETTGKAVANPRKRIDRATETYSEERKERFSQTLSEALNVIESLVNHLDALDGESLDRLSKIPNSFQEMLLEDSDQSISTSGVAKEQTLGARSLSLAMLAMAIGNEQTLPEEDVILLGQAGLLHDLSLYSMPQHFRDPSKTLTYDEATEYRRHPEISVEMLSDLPFVSDELRVLIQQVHELPDGTGYPKGLMAHRFHRLTWVLNLAELYVALTHRGTGRPPLAPYDAIRFLLFRCRDGDVKSDALRALINQFSLYGIGSQVEISDGATAKVLRRDADQFDLPVVEIDRNGESEMVRLSKSTLSILGPQRSPQQMRLDRSLAENAGLGDLVFS